MENVGASEDTTAESQSEETVESSGTGGTGESQGHGTGEEAVQGAGEGAEGEAENDIEIVEKDGKHFIPKERFDQIYGKMKQFESFIETIQSGPDALQQFVDK